MACRGSGTIDSPCEPRVIASTLDGDTPSDSAMKYRSREESSTPAIPMTRSFGKPETSEAR